jgi:putative copper export protein
MYEFLIPILNAIRTSPLADAVNSILWHQQGLETVHMTSFAIALGGVVLLGLRLIGITPRIPVAKLSRHVFPVIWLAFAGIVVSGSLMFAPRTTRIGRDQLFQTKLGMIALMVLGLLVIQFAVRRYADTWEAAGVPIPMRILAATCLVLCPAIVTTARFMYVF